MSELFDIEAQLHAEGFDLSAMKTAWMELSESKGWPVTEIGWTRYCRRTLDTGKGPMRPKAKAKVVTMVPADFVEWWSHHPESANGITARVAYIAAPYFNAWKAERQTARRAA